MSALLCMTCGAPLESYNRAYSGSWIAHRYADDCIAFLRAERDHAEAVAFWRGVCAERATEADERAERRRLDARFHGRVGNAVRAMLAMGSVAFSRTMATKLRAWALAEVPHG